MHYAKEVLDRLKEDYEIIVVSMGGNANLKLKKEWINKNLPFVQFIGCNYKKYRDKSHIDMSGAIFIDDFAHNLTTSNADYKIMFGDIYSWNELWMGERCFNWLDVERLLTMRGR